MKKKKIYNPSDSRKRRYVSSMRNRILAGVVAAVTAATPAVTYAADFGGYGLLNILGTDTGTESVEDNSGTVEVSSVTDVEESVEDVTKLAEDSEKSGDETETKFLFINLSGAEHGKIILNEGEDDERRIKLAKQTTTDDSGNSKEEMMINVYDKDDVLISTESAADNNYIYVCEAEADRAVTAKVVPDDGYLVSKYSLQDKLIDGVDENVGFEETDSEFSFPVFMKDNMSLTVGFIEKDNDGQNSGEEDAAKTDADITVNEKASNESESDDLTVADEDKEATDKSLNNENADSNTEKNMADSIDSEDNDITIEDAKTEATQETVTDENARSQETAEANDNNKTETVENDTTDNVDDAKSTSKDPESESESDIKDENDEKNIDEEVDNTDSDSNEHFITADAETNISELNADDFSSMRLIIITDDEDEIIDSEHMIGHYDNIYLMQYKSIEQTMNAYAYYERNVNAVEPDAQIVTASNEPEETNDMNIDAAEVSDNNAIALLNNTDVSETVQTVDKVIALIDTGVSENPNVIDRVSLIDDDVVGSSEHGDMMVEDIVSQNPDAKILSIRALGDNGYGSYSSVISAIEYAINSDVDIINMSMYTKKSMTTSIVKTEIEKAVDAGITVVGAAGNDGANVRNYIPGCSEAAYIIGACDNTGRRIETSNYGITVDYNVVADSTSEAAAKFTGYISKNGTDGLPDGNMIFENNYISDGADSNEDSYQEAENKVDSNLLFLYAMKAYGKDFADTLESTDFADIYNVSDVEMKEIKTKISEYFDEDDYDLNKNIERLSLLDANGVNLLDDAEQSEEEQQANEKKEAEVLNNIQISCDTAHLWEASKEGYEKEGASLSYVDNEYSASLLSGDMNALITTDVKLHNTENDIPPLNIEDKYDYAWEVLKNGTINVYVFPSGTAESDRRNFLSGTLMPESMNFKAAGDLASVGWKKWTGTKMYNNVLGINGDKYKKWLFDHSKFGARTDAARDYYLGTPYGVLFTWSSGSGAYPAGDKYPKKDYTDANGKVLQTGMNCTAFVWHVFWKSMGLSGNKKKPSDYGLGESRDNTLSGWINVPNNNNVKHAYFKTKKDLINVGKPRRGDIIWIMAAGEHTPGQTGCDNHILFYWGNGTNDVAWHSTHYTGKNTARANSSWCDGSLENIKGGHKVNTNGNCQTEIASKQPPDKGLYGYILYRTGGGSPQRVQIKKVTSTTNGWDDSLKGTQFTLYQGSKALKTITINSADAVTFDYDCEPGVTYVIKETRTAAGYKKADDIKFKVDDNNSDMVRKYTISNTPDKKPVNIHIQKASSCPEMLSLSSYSLADATFGIYSDAGCTNLLTTLKTNTDGSTPVFTTQVEASGTTYFYAKEISPPSGHNGTGQVQTITVNMPQDDNATKYLTFTNIAKYDDVPGAFVKKLDTKGNPVVGAIFEVRLYDGVYKTVAECQKYTPKKTWYLKSDTDGNVIFDARHLANDFKPSDSFYKDKNGEIKIPINCTVTFQEVKVPSEYQIDETVQLWSEKNQVVEVKKYYNYLKPCKINIRKLAEDGRTPLEGVEFELTFTKESEPYTDDALRSYNPLLKQGESIKATTNKDGYITWEDLDQGEYQIVETKTHDDMTLLKDPIKVTLPITMTDENAKEMSAATDKGKFDDYTNKWYFYEATFEVTNNAKFKMPMTGDNGFWKFGFIGFGTIAVLGTGLVVFDKKGKKQKHRKRVTKK